VTILSYRKKGLLKDVRLNLDIQHNKDLVSNLIFNIYPTPPKIYILTKNKQHAPIQIQPTTSHNLGKTSPLHPASFAINSAAFSPIANTVNIGLILVIVGKTPASAILAPFNPLTLNS
jgi:hypothetical protein